MFRAMFSPIARNTWLYLQYLVVFTQVAAGWQPTATWVCNLGVHTKRSSVQSDIYRVTYTEWNIPDVVLKQFSWWWAHGCPKHVETRNKHTWKRIVRRVGYLQRWIRVVYCVHIQACSGQSYWQWLYSSPWLTALVIPVSKSVISNDLYPGETKCPFWMVYFQCILLSKSREACALYTAQHS